MGIPIKDLQSDFEPVPVKGLHSSSEIITVKRTRISPEKGRRKKSPATPKTPNIPVKTSTKSEKPKKVASKTKKRSLPIAKICFFIFLLSAITVCGIIAWLSILPIKYYIVLLIIVAIITILLFVFTFKKSSGKVAKAICSIFSLLFTALFILIIFYLNRTIGFMDSIRAAEYQIDNYYVLVKKSSDYTKLEDLNDHTIATYDDENNNYQTAFNQLSEKVSLDPTNYGSVMNSANALINNLSDSLFIKSSLTEVVTEILPAFSMNDFDILDTIEIKTKIDSIADGNLNISEDSFNIFISGIDTYGAISTVSRSDVNMIVTVNPRSHTILLTSIPRDYYVQLHGTTGLKDKLTHAGLYGINMSIRTLEDLFKINIDYYVRVNFDSTISLIDALGGIDITPDVTFSRWTDGRHCYYEANRSNHLDGFCALRYARERKAYGTGDLHRIQNQQEVLTAVIDKLTSSKVLLAKYTDILSSMSNALETNIPSSQIYKLVNTQLDSMPSWNVERISVTGTHIDAPTYTIRDELLYVFVPDENSVTEATTKIKSVIEAN